MCRSSTCLLACLPVLLGVLVIHVSVRVFTCVIRCVGHPNVFWNALLCHPVCWSSTCLLECSPVLSGVSVIHVSVWMLTCAIRCVGHPHVSQSAHLCCQVCRSSICLLECSHVLSGVSVIHVAVGMLTVLPPLPMHLFSCCFRFEKPISSKETCVIKVSLCCQWKLGSLMILSSSEHCVAMVSLHPQGNPVLLREFCVIKGTLCCYGEPTSSMAAFLVMEHCVVMVSLYHQGKPLWSS